MKVFRTAAAIAATVGLATLAGGSAMATTTPTVQPNDATTCATTGHVPRWVRGITGRLIATPKGDVWIWHNKGWHLRVRHRGTAKMVFTGSITVADQSMAFRPYHLEANDSVTLAGDSKTIDFTFNNYGHLDGIDINAHCASQITFDLAVNGVAINPDKVHLGVKRLSALTVPVVISRR
jgi:hypothetical protein